MRTCLIISPYFPPSTLAGVHRARHSGEAPAGLGLEPSRRLRSRGLPRTKARCRTRQTRSAFGGRRKSRGAARKAHAPVRRGRDYLAGVVSAEARRLPSHSGKGRKSRPDYGFTLLSAEAAIPIGGDQASFCNCALVHSAHPQARSVKD